MKQSEIITQIIHYKSDINRMYNNKGKNIEIGFTLVNDKSPVLYYYHAKDRNILKTFYHATSAKDLLNAIKIVHSSIW